MPHDVIIILFMLHLVVTLVLASHGPRPLPFDPFSLVKTEYNKRDCKVGAEGWTVCKKAFLTFAARRVEREEARGGSLNSSPTPEFHFRNSPSTLPYRIEFEPQRCKVEYRGGRETGRYECKNVRWRKR